MELDPNIRRRLQVNRYRLGRGIGVSFTHIVPEARNGHDLSPSRGGVQMIEQTSAIATNAGQMETFICHPERHGPFPPVLLLMDAPGIREELKDMARRLAAVSYYVLLPICTTGPAATRSTDQACSKRAAQSVSACEPCAPR
jgi:hypothetical protein